jgi:hypothetical protein
MKEIPDYILEQMKPKTGADLEIEIMRHVYNDLARLDPAARQRVVGHAMGMLKDIPALTNGDGK